MSKIPHQKRGESIYFVIQYWESGYQTAVCCLKMLHFNCFLALPYTCKLEEEYVPRGSFFTVEGPGPHKWCGILCTANCFPEVSHRPLCAWCWTLPPEHDIYYHFHLEMLSWLRSNPWHWTGDSLSKKEGMEQVSRPSPEFSATHCTSMPAVSDSAPAAHGLRSKRALEYINWRRLVEGQTPCAQESSPRSDFTTVWLLWGHSYVWHLYPIRKINKHISSWGWTQNSPLFSRSNPV